MRTKLVLGLAAAATISISGLAAGQTKTTTASPAGQVKASLAASPKKAITTAEADALIDQAGGTSPDWWNQVQLNYPKTLDLTWDQVAQGWQPQKNLGAYVFSVIDPNPSKWKEGIRLMHHVLTVVKDNPQKLTTTYEQLGKMYFNYVQDYARAAYWYRKSGNQTGLAKSYFRLGDAQQAKKLIANASAGDTEAIRLCIEMGEYDLAIKMGEQLGQSRPQVGFLLAGDAAREAGKYQVAMGYYQKASQTTGDKKLMKFAEQAQASLQTLKVFESYDPAKLKDGTYKGSAKGYRGPVDVQVVIAKKKIQSVTVVQQKEDGYFYNIASVPIIKAIVDGQGMRGVDAVAGATLSSGAIINATAQAIAAAMP